MADLNLPSNVKQDPNTGLYIITNAQGKTVRVNADTQEQLNQYVNSVNTGVPATVTTTDPNTGNPRTRIFDSNAIIAEKDAINRQNELLTAGKRQAGVIGNRDGSYQDFKTGETITKEQAEAKIKAAGLPPETLAAVTPKDSPAFAAAQASINQTATAPSNIPPADALQPSQSGGGNSTSPEVTQSATPNTTAAAIPSGVFAPPAVDLAPVPADANASSSYTGAPAPVDTPLLTPAESIARAQVAAPAPVDAAAFNANTNASVLTAIGVPAAVDTGEVPVTGSPAAVEAGPSSGYTTPASQNYAQQFANSESAQQQATLLKAQDQRTLQQRYKQPGNQDWRVRLVLAEGATYLYKDSTNELLKPLANSNGVIFPYTPSISTAYVANYDRYDLVHSNYRGYFYKNSAVNDVQISGIFTAQDTAEAQYLLAVIHFFRSATKMFYGKDQERGAPPPLVYLVGYGEWQFAGHPCLITNFNYSLPADVDYIRASSPNNYGINLLNRQNPTSTSSSPTQGSVLTRLLNNKLEQGATPQNIKPNPSATGTGTVNNTQRPTYVPTKMEIAITLLPVNTRSQVSQQFSLKKFANGDLLKGGFW